MAISRVKSLQHRYNIRMSIGLLARSNLNIWLTGPLCTSVTNAKETIKSKTFLCD